MLTPEQYLSFLNGKGVTLWVNDGQLRYHAKKGTLTSEELSQLRAMKDGIVAMLTKMPHYAHEQPPLTSSIRVPLSLQQKWLLGLIQRHGDWKRALSFACQLQGELQPLALGRSLRRVVRRHEALRTRIKLAADGTWEQQVCGADDFRLEVTSLAGDTDEQRIREVRLTIKEVVARSMDPEAGSVFSARLLQASERDCFLILVFHRLVVDCLSISQVLRDLWILYGDELGQTQPQLATAQKKYRDYVIWQQTMADLWRQRHEVYWNEHLRDAQRIRWPADGSAISEGLASLQCSFGESVSEALRELGRRAQTLAAMVMLTVYVALVSRWCAQDDFVMPFLIAGRHSEHEEIVGYFSHVLYLRMQLKSSETFADLLKLVSNEFYRGVFRQDFGRIAMLRPELMGGTVCQWLSWHPADIVGLDTKEDTTRQLGLAVESFRFQSPEDLTNMPPAAVDLELSFFEIAGDISALAVYRQDRFAERNVVRLMKALRTVAGQFVADPLGLWRQSDLGLADEARA